MRLPVITPLLCLIALLSSGCAGVRFVVDVLPADDQLTETVVLEDRGAGSTTKIALIDLKGVIVDATPKGLLRDGENPVSRFTEALRTAADDRRIKAVVLRVNSPGGTVTASDVLYREVLDFRQRSSKPVVVLMGDVAASGGYYVSCAGDYVIAHPSTVTGSIGVIMQTFSVSDGLRKIGVVTDAITSGPNKALGSPLEIMSPQQREILQGIINEFYGRFVAIVKANRPSLDVDQIERVTDGRVVTGTDALSVGLVDEIGDLRAAFAKAKELAGVQSARLVKYHRPAEYVGSAYAQAPTGATQVNGVQVNISDLPGIGQGGFYYLWDPTLW